MHTKRFVRIAGILSLFALTSASLHAQRFGIVAGATYSKLRGVEDLDYRRRKGSVFGASLQLPFGRDYAIQPEFLFLNKGSNFKEGAYVTNSTIQLDYFEIPVLFRYNLSRGAVVPHVYGGPSVGFNVGCKLTLTGARTLPETDCKDDNFEPKKLDYGVIIGGGLDFNMGALALTGGARYGLGLADIRDDTNAEFKKRVNNGVVSLYVGVVVGRRTKK